MPQGLQVFYPDGTLKLDTTSLLGRVFGSISVPAGQASGTISNDQFVQGKPFLIGMFAMGAFTGSVITGPAFSQVSFTSSGSSINWTRSTNQYEGQLPAGIMYYGVF